MIKSYISIEGDYSFIKEIGETVVWGRDEAVRSAIKMVENHRKDIEAGNILFDDVIRIHENAKKLIAVTVNLDRQKLAAILFLSYAHLQN